MPILLSAIGSAPSRGWTMIDTWIVVTAALAAMACSLPGVWLVLRRQSLMGDVLSHTTLPGLVLGFLFVHALQTAGWIPPRSEPMVRHAVLFGGALLTGILSALLAEAIQHLGQVESSAALGVVLTTLFALGLLLIRLAADSVHLDQECVLFGTVESVGLGETGVPQATLAVGRILLVNLVLTALFYKELLIGAFDPGLATSQGFSARALHYGLVAVTAATVVSAFETVGSILVIAMLIVPAATAHLLTDRLPVLLLLSLLIAAASALLGHVAAIGLPPLIFGPLGYPEVEAASTAGMTAACCGLLFGVAMFFAPRHGVLSKAWIRWTLTLGILREDILGLLYRADESRAPGHPPHRHPVDELGKHFRGMSRGLLRVAIWQLSRRGLIVAGASGLHLAEGGREAAVRLVRAHRLWESYMSRHFAVPDDHLHASAEQVEHFLGEDLQKELAAELERPQRDPHGRTIPDAPS